MILYLLCSGCTSEKGNVSNYIQFKINASYPEKEIHLEEVVDIEYLQIEFDEYFLFSETPAIITKNIIIICRYIAGDILIFSRIGKPLSKFNHKGNGPREYTYIEKLLYDESSDELFIKSANKILVFSSSGEFKREIKLLNMSIREIFNYDSKTLLLYDDYNLYPSPFVIISKEDGRVVDSIEIPKGKEIELFVMRQDRANILIAPAYHIVKYNDGYLLTDFSIDTVFYLSNEKELSPVLVRKPSMQSMDPVIYLNSFVEAGNYEFVSAITVKNENNQLPRTYLMRDKKTGLIYRQKITFNDYKGKEVTLSPETIVNTQDNRFGFINLDLTELQDANHENKLSGRLKELVDKSDEDGNDIYMLLHFK